MTKASNVTGPPEGFEGEVSGLGLADILQLNAQNRFSGCIDVQCDGRRGLIFFRDGDVIHAEDGDTIGEEAFYAIVAWPGGHFSLQPNVATTRATIRKSGQHLILEAHRRMDEQRSGRGEPPSPAQPAAGKPIPAGALVEKLRHIPGVLYVVIQGKDGARAGDPTYEAEVLAGQALYVAMAGGQLGAKLQVGELASAAVQGTARHLLLFAARKHFLTLLVNSEAQLGPVEAAARKVLSAPR
jgi:predicted regulator of Ras-like GTPase activity (Roadblock/LC7/MglB family)